MKNTKKKSRTRAKKLTKQDLRKVNGGKYSSCFSQGLSSSLLEIESKYGKINFSDMEWM
jgi:hypothetical protein